MPREWCAHTHSLCWWPPKYHDEVTGEWWCFAHAGPLSWDDDALDVYLQAWLEAA